jgi:hypothetical protein
MKTPDGSKTPLTPAFRRRTGEKCLPNPPFAQDRQFD